MLRKKSCVTTKKNGCIKEEKCLFGSNLKSSNDEWNANRESKIITQKGLKNYI